MTTVYKYFIVFGLNQPNSAQAVAAVDGMMGAGSPTIVGDHCQITFWANIGDKPEKWAKGSIAKCKKILDSYGITYKLSMFNV